MKMHWHVTVVLLGVAMLHLAAWAAHSLGASYNSVLQAITFFPFMAGVFVAHWLGQGGHPAVNEPAALAAWVMQCLAFGLLLDAAVVFIRRRFRRGA
ncbi:MAG: hypothetical protein JNK23_22940 [Opitutaceae bacterium]|nr:hypothetical protein [Opitutaceae bacterium]